MHETHKAISRIARKVLRRRFFGALDMDRADPKEQAALIAFVASQVSSMDDKSIAYGAYAVDGLGNEPAVQNLLRALLMAYRAHMLKWFSGAIQARANMGGGGTGLKNLKDGMAAYIEDIPRQLAYGAQPMSSYIKGRISDIIDSAKMEAVGMKVFRVISDAARGANKTARTALPLSWDAQANTWFIPPKAPTFEVKDDLRRVGFKWNPALKRWETVRVTPAMKTLVQMDTPPPVSSGDIPGLTNWFFGEWLPKNITRFNTVFNTYLKSKETSYTFAFTIKSFGKVNVEIERTLVGPRDAVEELRYRYLGRQGRKPWLDVLDYYVDLTKTKDPKRVMFLLDRMNNLQHSNGLFMEQFPRNVQSWYFQFLDRKYSARDSWTLAKFIPDTDLRDIIQFFDRSGLVPVIRGEGQGAPDIPITPKEVPVNDVNWREKGYPREKGYQQPSRSDPKVQRDLEHLPTAW